MAMRDPLHLEPSPVDPRPSRLDGFDVLAKLALNMRWSWNHATDEVWRRLDPELWGITHNPWVVLQTASRDQIQSAWADPVFRKEVDGLVQMRRQAVEAPAWFQQKHSQSPLTCAAYFSMEFMLREALPIYSGGLGNVAGDQLKATSDLGVPVVGVGLLYQQGYFRQVIDQDGSQEALFPYNDPGQLPAVAAGFDCFPADLIARYLGAYAEQKLGIAQSDLLALDPSAIRVELYADGAGGGAPVRVEMTRDRPLAGPSGGYVYRGSVPAARSPASYTARLLPRREGVAVPLEVHSILWKH
jgi:uncharacterized protein DUF3417